jgi:hypothetical protein
MSGSSIGSSFVKNVEHSTTGAIVNLHVRNFAWILDLFRIHREEVDASTFLPLGKASGLECGDSCRSQVLAFDLVLFGVFDLSPLLFRHAGSCIEEVTRVSTERVNKESATINSVYSRMYSIDKVFVFDGAEIRLLEVNDDEKAPAKGSANNKAKTRMLKSVDSNIEE